MIFTCCCAVLVFVRSFVCWFVRSFVCSFVRSLFVVRCSLFVVRCSLFVVRSSVVRCSWFNRSFVRCRRAVSCRRRFHVRVIPPSYPEGVGQSPLWALAKCSAPLQLWLTCCGRGVVTLQVAAGFRFLGAKSSYIRASSATDGK